MTPETGINIFVTIRLLGFLRKWAECAGANVEIKAGSTVDQLLNQIALLCGDEFRTAILDHSGRLHGGFELILNGQVISPGKIGEVTIFENSELVLIPVIAGGCFP
jgi:hypothetical protein